jgi:hypothetical protein
MISLLNESLPIQSIEVQLVLHLPKIPAVETVLVLLLFDDEFESVGGATPVGLFVAEIIEEVDLVLLLHLQALDVAADLDLEAVLLAVADEHSLEHVGVPARLVAEELNDAFGDHACSEEGLVLLEPLNDLVDLLVEEGALEGGRHEAGELLVLHLELAESQRVQLDEMAEGVVEGVHRCAFLHRQLDLLVPQPVNDLLHLQNQLAVLLLALKRVLQRPHLPQEEVYGVVFGLEEREETALVLGDGQDIAEHFIVEEHVNLAVDVDGQSVVLQVVVESAGDDVEHLPSSVAAEDLDGQVLISEDVAEVDHQVELPSLWKRVRVGVVDPPQTALHPGNPHLQVSLP